MKLASLFTVAFLAASASAATDADTKIVLAAAPTSNTCDNAPAAGQCATAQQAVGPIISSFEQYKILTPGEQATILAWMAFESGDFKYNKATYGDTPPGKGNRCMISPSFNAEYAKTVNNNEADPAAMLQKLIADGHEYDACAWFYSAKCSNAVKTAVQAGTKDGHTQFLKTCVQTDVTDARYKVWMQTAKAFGLSGN